MKINQQSVHRLSFDGHLLRRGFWLYVWRITSGRRVVFYVGRTGDSSSNFASSPFVRIGRHLDSRLNAKSNSLYRHLKDRNFDPSSCNFEFFAFGPLFSEQTKTADHRLFRDMTGALEFFLADELRKHCFEVIGPKSSRLKPATSGTAKIQKLINSLFQKPRNA